MALDPLLVAVLDAAAKPGGPWTTYAIWERLPPIGGHSAGLTHARKGLEILARMDHVIDEAGEWMITSAGQRALRETE